MACDQFIEVGPVTTSSQTTYMELLHINYFNQSLLDAQGFATCQEMADVLNTPDFGVVGVPHTKAITQALSFNPSDVVRLNPGNTDHFVANFYVIDLLGVQTQYGTIEYTGSGLINNTTYPGGSIPIDGVSIAGVSMSLASIPPFASLNLKYTAPFGVIVFSDPAGYVSCVVPSCVAPIVTTTIEYRYGTKFSNFTKFVNPFGFSK